MKRTFVRIALVTFAAFLFAAPAARADILNGPWLQELSAASVTVKWEEAPASPTAIVSIISAAPAVHYGREGIDECCACPSQITPICKAVLEGLSPATEYFYRVEDGASKSHIYRFRTPPESGAINFVVYGDSRTNAADHAMVCAAIAGQKPLFVLHVGDFTTDGRLPGFWKKEFFEPAQPLFARAAIFPVPGNHEYEDKSYYDYLGSPAGRPWYSFDCANAHFDCLDSCLPMTPGTDQYKWFEADLAATDARWRFVIFHHPLFSSGEHSSEDALRQAIWPLLEKYEVDAVFAGHDHHYERTFPMIRGLDGVVETQHPILHVVTGGGGAPLRGASGDYFTASRFSGLNFCSISVNADVLNLTAMDVFSNPVDRLTIVKSSAGYAGTYPAQTAAVEVADAEAMAKKAMATQEIAQPRLDEPVELTLKFTAPEWSNLDMTLEAEPNDAAPCAIIEPVSASLFIPAGGVGQVTFTVICTDGHAAAPLIGVTGGTSLGRFTFARKPLEFVRQQ